MMSWQRATECVKKRGWHTRLGHRKQRRKEGRKGCIIGRISPHSFLPLRRRSRLIGNTTLQGGKSTTRTHVYDDFISGIRPTSHHQKPQKSTNQHQHNHHHQTTSTFSTLGIATLFHYVNWVQGGRLQGNGSSPLWSWSRFPGIQFRCF